MPRKNVKQNGKPLERTSSKIMNTITPQPTLPVAPEIEEDVIELTISEVDRQTAEPYGDIENCLIATALKNRGFNVFCVGPDEVALDSAWDAWGFEGFMGPSQLCRDLNAVTAPFYGPSVVGKVIRLRKVKS